MGKKLNFKELQNLSNMLLSNIPENILLVFEILSNYPVHYKIFSRELVLAWQLNKDRLVRQTAKAILQEKNSPNQMHKWEEGFKIFEEYKYHYLYSGYVDELIVKHENIRPDFITFLCQNKDYAARYLRLAEKIKHRYKRHNNLIPEYLNIVLATDPDNLKALFNLAVYWHQHNNIDKALLHYKKILKISPSETEVHFNVSLIYESNLQLDQAYKHAKEAYMQRPYDVQNKRHLLSLCTHFPQHNQDEHLPIELVKKLENAEKMALNYNALAQYYTMIQKDIPKAKATYEKGLELEADNPYLLGNLAELYIEYLSDEEHAYHLYKKAIELDPTSTYWLINIISLLVLFRQNYAEARRYYKSLLELSTDQKIFRPTTLSMPQWEAFQRAQQIILRKQ